MTGAKDKTNNGECKEAEVNKDEAIKKMRDIVEDAKLSGYYLRTDDAYLRRFLYCTAWDPKAAASRVLDFCRLKSENPGYFCGAETRLEDFDELLDRGVKFLPGITDKEGRPVFVVKIGRVDPSRTDCQTVNRLDDLWIESILDQEEVQSSGICVLMDIKDYSWRLFTWLTPHNIKMSSLKMDTGPVRQTRMHIVNSSRLLNAAIAVAYPLLSDRIKENIHFHHSNWSSLHAFIDPDKLPAEYGGTGPDFDLKKITTTLKAMHDKVKDNFRWGYEKPK